MIDKQASDVPLIPDSEGLACFASPQRTNLYIKFSPVHLSSSDGRIINTSNIAYPKPTLAFLLPSVRKMTKFAISVTSDTVCPWCFVGKRKLDAGIALYKKHHPATPDTFTITWLAYQLNPHSPKQGVNKRDYYISRFGPERVAMMIPRLTDVGKSIGIDFSFGGLTGNTRDSHRLIYLAGAKHGVEMQNEVVEQLGKAYFENEGDITDLEMLTAAAVEAGLDREEVQGWLKSDLGGKEVDAQAIEARATGVTGVPNFVLQDKYEIGGAQDPEAFLKVFEKIKEMEKS